MSEQLDGEERLVAEIPSELKRLADADHRSIKEIVEASLWREFGGEKLGALERRLEEKKDRRSMVERERNERNRELAQLDDEIAALENKLDSIEEDEQAERKEWLQKVRMVPDEEDHPIVQEAAEKLNMTPADVLEESGSR